MELIHKQPVNWTHDRVVACDGGGGPHGHPRIFINTDKPEISICNYCGLPYVRAGAAEPSLARHLELTLWSLGERTPPRASRIPTANIIPSGGCGGSWCPPTPVTASPASLDMGILARLRVYIERIVRLERNSVHDFSYLNWQTGLLRR